MLTLLCVNLLNEACPRYLAGHNWPDGLIFALANVDTS
jgi:hypothetical protein